MRFRLDGSLTGSAVLTAAALATLLMAVPRLRADDDCQRRVAHADHKMHEAIEHHGYQSQQAEHWRHELHEATGSQEVRQPANGPEGAGHSSQGTRSFRKFRRRPSTSGG